MNSGKKEKADKLKERQVTYDIYAEMPDDGARYELLDGILELMSPGPPVSHQIISREMVIRLNQSCSLDYMILNAPLDVILDQTNVLQPDILMVHRSRLSIVTERGVEGPPDLVAEILSPGSRSRDKVVKMDIYARHGVPEYWIIDGASRTLEQYLPVEGAAHYVLHRLYEGNDTVASDKLPCVAFNVSDLFAELLN